MTTYKITSREGLEKHKDEYGYHIQGNAEFSYSANLDKRLLVDGYLSIKAGEYIEAGGYIKAGWFIETGESNGISAGLYISCKQTLSFGLKVFAGVCTWIEITDEDKTITCSKMIGGGEVGYGMLNETGEIEQDDKTEEAMKLLKEKGYKIVKETK